MRKLTGASGETIIVHTPQGNVHVHCGVWNGDGKALSSVSIEANPGVRIETNHHLRMIQEEA